jgi:hypothetical protein
MERDNIEGKTKLHFGGGIRGYIYFERIKGSESHLLRATSY